MNKNRMPENRTSENRTPENRISDKAIIGWREWVSFPDIGIDKIKAKVDTGARTSALHAFNIEEFSFNGQKMVRFKIHPLQRDNDYIVVCEAAVIDTREVTDSGGHCEKRFVIETPITIGNETFSIEATLTDRDTMKFRMLLGRTALEKRFIVDSSKSYVLSKNINRKKGIEK